MEIKSFRGKHSFLSNFYDCPVQYDGTMYRNAESAFQAAKCADSKERALFEETSGSQAKKLGRRVSLRPDWESIKVHVMYEIVSDKFQRNAEIAEKLIETGDSELIEGNVWGDTFWGVCNGRGENHLGKILMAVRNELKEEKK